jgi:hypothetical protein
MDNGTDREATDPNKVHEQLANRLSFWRTALETAETNGRDAEAVQCRRVVDETEAALMALRAEYRITK